MPRGDRNRQQEADALTVPATPPTPTGAPLRQPTFIPGQNRHPGRPSKLTPVVETKLMTALRAGQTIRGAARYAGLSPDTVERWIARGRGRDVNFPPKPEYIRLARLVDENQAHAALLVTGNLVARSRVDTRAAEVWLRGPANPERAEWLDDELPPPPPTGDTNVSIDAREQTVIVIPAGEVPDTVRALLARKRREHPVEPVIMEHKERPLGPSNIRSAGLREDG
jgi:hypothetical protein